MKSEKIAVVCNECGKKFSGTFVNRDPQCPKCGSVDIDVR